ncbi:DNA methylase [Thalassospira profundimaris]|uniref:site-specific DNA-methyltransferase n=1 Tax=Thalassospira TaxID=168934 RepID=UPI0002872901|nr:MULTISPECIES: ParB N-terminal domain-containing protein [Thalassospira]EKF09291.1 nuclease [Thalassospira profundimaris WP0211]MBC06196.1 DNA methylase [Thalassospira sp.]RCK26792.1 DNA methylase [Thalassospira profundimaris]|tara:strand:- start:1940 stop:3268 length:1329 start_codon:yes stop_codon:yes gene_type:complete
MDLTIETVPVDRLIPYARNARTHDEGQVAQIAGSIAEFGFVNPILIGEDGGVIAGHGRLMAARKLGLDDVPVIRLGHLSETQRRALIIADNKIAENAGWDEELLRLELADLKAQDFDLDLTGFDLSEIDRLLESEDGEQQAGGFVAEDTIPEPPVEPVSRPGDLWLLGDHRLLCGDSTNADDVKRLMNGERAILFATDPPYLVDYDGTNHPQNSARKAKVAKGDTSGTDGNKDWSATYGVTWDDSSQGPDLYRGFIKAAIAEAIEPNAAWYCWHASRRQAMLEEVWTEMGAFQHQQIIWNKEKGVLTRSRYLWKHEPCLMGWIKGNMPPKADGAEFLPSVWDIHGLSGEERPDHPTPKPLDCFATPMRQHVEPGGLCYEPFSGSGSQIMAGESVGRRVFAMEISPVYVDVAVERWQKATGKTAVLDGDDRTFDEIKEERTRG